MGKKNGITNVSHACSSPVRMRSACGYYDITGRRKGNSNSINGSEAHGGQDVPHMRMKHHEHRLSETIKPGETDILNLM